MRPSGVTFETHGADGSGLTSETTVAWWCSAQLGGSSCVTSGAPIVSFGNENGQPSITAQAAGAGFFQASKGDMVARARLRVVPTRPYFEEFEGFDLDQPD